MFPRALRFTKATACRRGRFVEFIFTFWRIDLRSCCFQIDELRFRARGDAFRSLGTCQKLAGGGGGVETERGSQLFEPQKREGS